MLRHGCNDSVAATDLKKAKLALRTASGWRKLECPSATDALQKVTLYATFDEGPRAKRENGGGRALGKIVRKLLPKERIMVRGNTVYLDNAALVRCAANEQGEPTKLQYLPKNMQDAKLDAAVVKTEFDRGAPVPVPEHDWQSL